MTRSTVTDVLTQAGSAVGAAGEGTRDLAVSAVEAVQKQRFARRGAAVLGAVALAAIIITTARGRRSEAA